eukprot:1210339-Pyramimonas_sp.AAC.2
MCIILGSFEVHGFPIAGHDYASPHTGRGPHGLPRAHSVLALSDTRPIPTRTATKHDKACGSFRTKK